MSLISDGPNLWWNWKSTNLLNAKPVFGGGRRDSGPFPRWNDKFMCNTLRSNGVHPGITSCCAPSETNSIEQMYRQASNIFTKLTGCVGHPTDKCTCQPLLATSLCGRSGPSITGLIKILRMDKHSPIQAPSHNPEGGVEAGVLRPSGRKRYMRNQHPAAMTMTAVGHIATVVDWKPQCEGAGWGGIRKAWTWARGIRKVEREGLGRKDCGFGKGKTSHTNGRRSLTRSHQGQQGMRMGKHSPIKAPSYSPEGGVEAGALRPSGRWLKITAVGQVAPVVDWKPRRGAEGACRHLNSKNRFQSRSRGNREGGSREATRQGSLVGRIMGLGVDFVRGLKEEASRLSWSDLEISFLWLTDADGDPP
ncbi:hypothetical protein JOM56_014484 [Amanita muscaria]